MKLEWFTTIPGILVTCGVILLIIAIILFIVGARKSKKEMTVSEQSRSVDTTNESFSEMPIQPQVEVEPVSEIPVQSQIEVEPVMESVQPVTIEEPVVVPDTITSFEETTPNVVSFEAASEEDSQIQPSIVDMPAMENSQPESVTIYGGNDPLEATQTLPKVEEHHEPYGGAMNEAKIVEPVAVEIPEPIQEPVFTMPIIDDSASIVEEAPVMPEPAIVDIPTVEPMVTTVPEEKPIVEEL